MFFVMTLRFWSKPISFARENCVHRRKGIPLRLFQVETLKLRPCNFVGGTYLIGVAAAALMLINHDDRIKAFAAELMRMAADAVSFAESPESFPIAVKRIRSSIRQSSRW